MRLQKAQKGVIKVDPELGISAKIGWTLRKAEEKARHENQAGANSDLKALRGHLRNLLGPGNTNEDLQCLERLIHEAQRGIARKDWSYAVQEIWRTWRLFQELTM